MKPVRHLAAPIGVVLAVLVLALMLRAPDPARADEREALAGPVAAEVVRVVDGDTLEVTARLWPDLALTSLVRLADIDAPELAGRCAAERALARRVRDRLAALVHDAAAPTVRLHAVRLGKYAGRVVARVETETGLDLGGGLLAAGLARAYDGRSRASWCGATVDRSGPMLTLLEVVQERGIKNALSVVQRMNNLHLEDDFHRVIVQYIRRGYEPKGVSTRESLWRVLNMTLYEVHLPETAKETDKSKSLKELVSAMEQFYAGMFSIVSKKTIGKHHFVLEVAVSDESDDIVFYAAVPNHSKDLFEKHLLSIFPDAHIIEQENDYNIFVDGGVSLISVGHYTEHHSLPIKTYDQFDYDPLNVLLNSFSKIEKEGGGAALQVIFSPSRKKYLKKYKRILGDVQDGKSLKEATRGLFMELASGTGSAVSEIFTSSSSDDKKEAEKKSKTDQSVIESLQQKIATPIVDTNIRLVASGETKERAQSILNELESAFNQFENTKGNTLRFKRLSMGARGNLHLFIYRDFSRGHIVPMSLRELSSIMHFPGLGIKSSPQFKQARANTAPAPMNMPQEGTLLGVNTFRNKETPVFLTKEDRMRHFYVIGQTGTGKTTLLKNMIIQDIDQGEGVCMIDPHGEDIIDVLGAVPEHRRDDVIYFDPAYVDRVMAFNMLEYDPNFPEQKTFVIDELFNIFKKLYGAIPEAMGPMFEQYFRNATALVLESPRLGNTLLDVSKVFANRDFRKEKLAASKNPVVNQFWEEIAARATGDQSIESIAPYITSKFDVFLANEIMRPIIGQEKSSFNFREIIDNRKILLVNLSKGRLGDLNANLIGLILVGKILMAALSRSSGDIRSLPPFYLYIDEFQNITTPSIATILSEARKYKLSLTIGHQFIAQLQEEIKKAVFGNVGSLSVFRVGSEDAEFLEKQFQPTFSTSDLINIENYNAYVRLLVNGTPAKPFNMRTLPSPERDTGAVEMLKRLSYEKYGTPRGEVEEAILKKYLKPKPKPRSSSASRSIFD